MSIPRIGLEIAFCSPCHREILSAYAGARAYSLPTRAGPHGRGQFARPYFFDSGVVSVVAVYANGNVIEMATIGREGCTGMQAVLGAKSSSARLLVKSRELPRGCRARYSRAMGSMPPFRNLNYATSWPFSSRHGVGRVQWRAQSQATARALASHDARSLRR
jgi:hypothetical protein